MTNKSIKKITRAFIKKYKLINIEYSSLKKAAMEIGYTMIDFNSVKNNKDVETVIESLQLGDLISKSRGFTYTDANYRLIFINEDLNEEEKLFVMSHELGHIVCGHFGTMSVIGNDVREEYEANEFSHYLLNQGVGCKLRRQVYRHKRIAIGTVIIIILMIVSIVAFLCIRKEQSYYDDFYVTTMGEKYHKPKCIYVKYNNNVTRLTKEQYESGDYEPCGTCLPDD